MKKKNISPNSFEWSNWKIIQWSCSTNENLLQQTKKRTFLHNEEIYFWWFVFSSQSSLSCHYEHRTMIIEVPVQRRDLINQNKLLKYFFSNGNEKHLINSRQIDSTSTLAQAETLSLNTSLIWTNSLCLFYNESIGSKMHKKNIFTIVEWWDFFVWKMKFSSLIASPPSDSIVCCRFSSTIEEKLH